jgi:hypothetical protein
MEQFADVAKARETYAIFAAAMEKGRDILLRAGIAAAPPPVPEFDLVFRRLDPSLRQTLYEQLGKLESPAAVTGDAVTGAAITPADAIRIWQPLLKRAFPKAVSSRARSGGPGRPPQ